MIKFQTTFLVSIYAHAYIGICILYYKVFCTTIKMEKNPITQALADFYFKPSDQTEAGLFKGYTIIGVMNSSSSSIVTCIGYKNSDKNTKLIFKIFINNLQIKSINFLPDIILMKETTTWKQDMEAVATNVLQEGEIYKNMTKTSLLKRNTIQFFAEEKTPSTTVKMHPEQFSLPSQLRSLMTHTNLDFYNFDIAAVVTVNEPDTVPLKKYFTPKTSKEQVIAILIQLMWVIQQLQTSHLRHNILNQDNILISATWPKNTDQCYNASISLQEDKYRVFQLKPASPRVIFYNWCNMEEQSVKTLSKERQLKDRKTLLKEQKPLLKEQKTQEQNDSLNIFTDLISLLDKHTHLKNIQEFLKDNKHLPTQSLFTQPLIAEF